MDSSVAVLETQKVELDAHGKARVSALGVMTPLSPLGAHGLCCWFLLLPASFVLNICVEELFSIVPLPALSPPQLAESLEEQFGRLQMKLHAGSKIGEMELLDFSQQQIKKERKGGVMALCVGLRVAELCTHPTCLCSNVFKITASQHACTCVLLVAVQTFTLSVVFASSCTRTWSREQHQQPQESSV